MKGMVPYHQSVHCKALQVHCLFRRLNSKAIFNCLDGAQCMRNAACPAYPCNKLWDCLNRLIPDCLCKEALVLHQLNFDFLDYAIADFYREVCMALHLAHVLYAYVEAFHLIPNSFRQDSSIARKSFSDIGQPGTCASTLTTSERGTTFSASLKRSKRNAISFFFSSSKRFLWAEGIPVTAQEPIATSFLQLSLIFLAFPASFSDAIAPSTKATSRPLSMLFFFSILTCWNSM